ncbi:hypothetical protein DQP56_19065 [Mycolicibacter senuensis]|nr:hypothetical protein DQP56_19065 [Mycolicibacter senuensis]
MAPLATAPDAHADGLDWLMDLFDPTLIAGSAVDTTGADDVFGDSPFWDQLLLSNPDLDPASVVESWMYDPWHTAMEAWITSGLGQQIDQALTAAYVAINGEDSLDGACGLICNGVDGTQTDPDGGAGGLWFGDGGDGWDSTVQGLDGGDGGAAGFFGNGGDGGDGWDPHRRRHRSHERPRRHRRQRRQRRQRRKQHRFRHRRPRWRWRSRRQRRRRCRQDQGWRRRHRWHRRQVGQRGRRPRRQARGSN